MLCWRCKGYEDDFFKQLKGIVNSPPYSTALDYIKNNEPLAHLNLHDKKFQELPEFARRTIADLINGGRVDAALRSFKFFTDMQKSLEENRVLMPKANAANRVQTG